jgi:hypothetical protein
MRRRSGGHRQLALAAEEPIVDQLLAGILQRLLQQGQPFRFMHIHAWSWCLLLMKVPSPALSGLRCCGGSILEGICWFS